MTLLTNQASRIYPKDEIYSYKVIVIKKETIKENDGIYTYDAYKFNSLNEYNNWKTNKGIEDRDKEIVELKNKNTELENRLSSLEVVPDLPSRTKENADNIAINEETINSIMTEIIPSLFNME